MSDVAPPGRSLLIRLLGLAALIAAVNSWSIRHLGQDLTKLSFLNASVAVFGFLFALLRDREKKLLTGEKKRRWRRRLGQLLDPTVLVGLVIVFGLAGSFVTSVTVLADGTPGQRTVHVTPEGRERAGAHGKSLADADATVRFLRWTTPFGRPFYAEVDGYLRHSFDLYPWIGATLRVGRDLRPAPTVLVRVPLEWFALLAGGDLRITYDGKTYKTATADQRAAVLLGRATAAPEDRLDHWRSTLAADRHEEAVIEQAVLAWKDPVPAEGLPPLGPGAELVIDFFTDSGDAGNRVTGINYTLTTDGFQDVELPVRR